VRRTGGYSQEDWRTVRSPAWSAWTVSRGLKAEASLGRAGGPQGGAVHW
jgi:hypothetical protein